MKIKKEEFEKYLKIIREDHKLNRKFEIEPLLYFPMYNLSGGQVSLLKILLGYLSNILKYRFVEKGYGKTVFIIGMDGCLRKSYKDMISSVSGLLNKQQRKVIYVVKDFHLDLKVLYLAVFLPKWLWDTRKKDIPFDYKICFGIQLCRMAVERKNIKRILTVKPDLWITFCDVCPTESLMVQEMNKKGVMTVTLQHGHFNAADRGWVYRLSKSRFFLAHGEYARNEAIKAGMKPECIKILGMLNFLEVKPVREKTQDNRFGIFLNGPGAREDNKDILRIANKIAEEENLKYWLRCHPAVPAALYADEIDERYCLGECKESMSIEDFIDRIAFAVVGNSTVFIETVKRNKAAFRFVRHTYDIYEGIDWCKVKSSEELKDKYREYVKEGNCAKQIKKTFDYLCSAGNIAENYTNFFIEAADGTV